MRAWHLFFVPLLISTSNLQHVKAIQFPLCLQSLPGTCLLSIMLSLIWLLWETEFCDKGLSSCGQNTHHFQSNLITFSLFARPPLVCFFSNSQFVSRNATRKTNQRLNRRIALAFFLVFFLLSLRQMPAKMLNGWVNDVTTRIWGWRWLAKKIVITLTIF